MSNVGVICLSGGLDSAVLAYDLKANFQALSAISFHYGQRHIKEINYAEKLAEKLGISFKLAAVADVMGGGPNFLTGGTPSSRPWPLVDVLSRGQSIEAVVVPNRNALFLSLAVTYAIGINADSVYFAPTAEDFDVFPDCRPKFVKAFNALLEAADLDCRVFAPYINKTKAEVVALGRRLHVPLEMTWSCYQGLKNPCGECPACIKRNEAMNA